ncbi:hypothetical protein CWATWH0402_607 [Crocosphaera watsonii WH 0402]|uniref:Uncharacterized protein n=1 Tax=Crocosphaera watsonii WH 0402 TaxID=1284629 RepID=T2JXI8_CROWT|nr:hypothetical protein CWATWH0402_607 [Crocosphaera watsonii WH 0402]
MTFFLFLFLLICARELIELLIVKSILHEDFSQSQEYSYLLSTFIS